MKLSETKFKCDWCDNRQKHQPHKMSDGSFNHGQVICDKCFRHISQKTKIERMSKK